jgi:hypothetical protein
MRSAFPLFMLITGLFAASGCTTSNGVGSDYPGGGPTTGSTGGDATVGVRVGSVLVREGALGPETLQGSQVTAGFRDAPDGTNGVSTTRWIGPCAISVYTTEPVDGTSVYRSAGVVTISGLDMPVSLAPTGSGVTLYSDSSSFTNSLFSGGESLTFSATGAAVPAFTATLVAPSLIDLQSPAVPANGVPFVLDRSADLIFAWSGGGFGTVDVTFSDSTNAAVDCNFPSSAGTGTIPEAALAALAPNAAGFFQINVQSYVEQTIGGWTILTAAGRSIQVKGASLVTTDTYQASN